MFDHVLVRVADRPASERFFATVLEPLDVEPFAPAEGITRWGNLGITESDGSHPSPRGLHLGLAVASRELVEAFWRAGIAAGYVSSGAPGPRPECGERYFGSSLLDPDGNSVEAVHHEDAAGGGLIDHVWLRVSDLAATRAFYATIAPQTGFALVTDTPERVVFRGDAGSLALLPGPATEHLHMAFAVPDDATVRAFHDAAITAGYRDNGGPGARPRFGRGYYGAFVCDPDGINVEAVHIDA